MIGMKSHVKAKNFYRGAQSEQVWQLWFMATASFYSIICSNFTLRHLNQERKLTKLFWIVGSSKFKTDGIKDLLKMTEVVIECEFISIFTTVSCKRQTNPRFQKRLACSLICRSYLGLDTLARYQTLELDVCNDEWEVKFQF